jgi:hypothetical protein
MDILNKASINQQRAKNPFIGKSPEEIDQAIATLGPLADKERNSGLRSKAASFVGDVSDVFLQSGGIKTRDGDKSSRIDDIITKAALEDMLKSRTPEGRLARKKAEFELSQGEETPIASEAPQMEEVTPISAESAVSAPSKSAPAQYIKIPTEEYPGYKTVENPEYKTYQKRQEKVGEMDVKKLQLREDLDTFFAVDDLIDRARGGLLDTRGAAFNTWWKSVDQPIDPNTGLPDPKGAAAATHAAASKRLRVQLVRAAGDVGNINIVEQEAAEKLIPRWDDSETTAKLKRAYLKQVSKAIGSGDENEVKKVLREIGIGYSAKTPSGLPTQSKGSTPSFASEEEAEASGYKGDAIISGRRARID